MKPNKAQQAFLDEIIDEVKSIKNTNDIVSPSNPNIDEIQRIINDYFDEETIEEYSLEEELEEAIKIILNLTRKLNDHG